MIERDKAEYCMEGALGNHSKAWVLLEGYPTTSNMQKEIVKTTNDTKINNTILSIRAMHMRQHIQIMPIPLMKHQIMERSKNKSQERFMIYYQKECM